MLHLVGVMLWEEISKGILLIVLRVLVMFHFVLMVHVVMMILLLVIIFQNLNVMNLMEHGILQMKKEIHRYVVVVHDGRVVGVKVIKDIVFGEKLQPKLMQKFPILLEVHVEK